MYVEIACHPIDMRQIDVLYLNIQLATIVMLNMGHYTSLFK